MVVVLPAPFGPRNPVIRPGSTVKDSWSTASLSPYRLVRPRASIIAGSFLGGAGTMPVRRVRPVFRDSKGWRVAQGADSYPPRVVGRVSTSGRFRGPGITPGDGAGPAQPGRLSRRARSPHPWTRQRRTVPAGHRW